MSSDQDETATVFEVALLEFSLSCRIAAPFLTDVVMKLGEKAFEAAGSPPIAPQVVVKPQVPEKVNVSARELSQVGILIILFVYFPGNSNS